MKAGNPFKKIEQALIHKPGGISGMQGFIKGGAIEGADTFFFSVYQVIIAVIMEDIKAVSVYPDEINGRIEFTQEY